MTARATAAVTKVRASMPDDFSAGVVVAEGDSWFDYPGVDILAELEDRHNFDVLNAAHKGDTAESMAYGPQQLEKVARMLLKLRSGSVTPQAFLISAGGNDIVGGEFATLLNHKASGRPALNAAAVEAALERVLLALVTIFENVTAMSVQVFGLVRPIVVHGYDYTIPDGRGFWGGWGPLPGPWLQPGFRQKGYGDLAANAAVLRSLMDQFNVGLLAIPRRPGLGHVHVLDLCGTLSDHLKDERYRTHWADELHPSPEGFRIVAAKFAAAIAEVQ